MDEFQGLAKACQNLTENEKNQEEFEFEKETAMRTWPKALLGMGIIVLLFAGAVTGGALFSPRISNAAEQAAQTVEWLAISAGDFSVTERTPIIVREVDFRGSSPVVFFHIRWLEINESLKFGVDVVTTGANRDGWMPNGAASIQEANAIALELAIADVKGNIPGAVVWFQLECPSRQLETARSQGLELNDLDPSTGENWFVRVMKEGLDPIFIEVCDASQVVETSTPTATPSVATPTAEPTVPTVHPDCTARTVLAYRADEDKDIPLNEWAVEEIVDNNAGVITIQPKLISTTTTAQVVGATHYNYWSCYGSLRSAEIGARAEFVERSKSASTPQAWNYGYTVILMDKDGKEVKRN